MVRTRSLTGLRTVNSPVTQREAVGDISTTDFTPAAQSFRAINASVAGLITIQGFDEQWVQVYVNTGWNPDCGLAIRNRTSASSDTATIKAVGADI